MAVPAFKFPRPAKLQLVGGEWRGSMGKCDPGHQLNIGGIGAKTSIDQKLISTVGINW